jgi:hypothetical protein
MERSRKNRDVKQLLPIYTKCLINRTITIPITAVGKNLSSTIETNIAATFEGKCVIEGFVKPNSCKLITYSSGLIQKGDHISFEIVVECDVCFPVENMLVSCVAKNITKAGIRAESSTESPSPIVVFIAKDHNYDNPMFGDINEGDEFTTRVIGQRFELNDKYISMIGEIVKKPRNN